jgi:hypothetical protein
VPAILAGADIVAAPPISWPAAELAPPMPPTAAVPTDEARDALLEPAVADAVTTALPMATLVMVAPTDPAAPIKALIAAPPETVSAAVVPMREAAVDWTLADCVAEAVELNDAVS